MRSSLLICLLALALTPAVATATAGQESGFQDDNSLIFNTTAGTTKTLDTLRELGVDRIRVSVFWATVAPQSDAQARPAFDATDPAAYPPGSWSRYDQVVRLARARGIDVNFNITSPAPLWATGDAPRPDIAKTWQPDAQEFARFVQAVGTRYGGGYRAPISTTVRGGRAVPRQSPPLCVLLNNCPPAEPAPGTPGGGAADQPLPRVSYWSIWNEPNQPGWLTPQWTTTSTGSLVEAAPRLYRDLVDGAFTGLQASGHGKDTILVGETAPKGLNQRGPTRAIKALRFVRALYCVDARLRPLLGTSAEQRGCPVTGDATAFPKAHPGLFAATGYAHHPYELTFAPDVRPKDRDYVTIANLPALSTTLRSIYARYGRRTAAGPPLYLTEFGYNTNPPNRAGVTLREQAAYLNQAEFIARSSSRVRSLTQFLLLDDAQRPGRDGTTGTSATFQTGLAFIDGRRKPSFAAYELPVWLPRTSVRRRGTLRVWGLVRPARSLGGKVQRVTISLTSGGTRRTLATVSTRRGSGILDARVRVPRSGSLRLSWRDGRRSGRIVTSRAVTVTAR
jgi:hypothetical protein